MKPGTAVHVKRTRGEASHSLCVGPAVCKGKAHKHGYWFLEGTDKETGNKVVQMVFEDDFREAY